MSFDFRKRHGCTRLQLIKIEVERENQKNFKTVIRRRTFGRIIFWSIPFELSYKSKKNIINQNAEPDRRVRSGELSSSLVMQVYRTHQV